MFNIYNSSTFKIDDGSGVVGTLSEVQKDGHSEMVLAFGSDNGCTWLWGIVWAFHGTEAEDWACTTAAASTVAYKSVPDLMCC